VFLEQLFVNYSEHGYSLLAGKYNPKFGMAPGAAPGLYGAEFADGYELTEGVGVSASYELVHDDNWGEHEVTASLFFLDNTPLSRSFLSTPTARAFQTTERIGQRRFYAGKPGNTYAPQSYAIILEGGSLAALPDLKYQIGYRQLQRGTNDQQIKDYASRDERGFAAGVEYVFDLGNGLQITPLIEHVWLTNANMSSNDPDGQPGFGRIHFLTTALSLDHGGWKLSASRTQRDKNAYNPGTGNQGSHLVTSSLEYDFGNGFNAGVGWARIKEKPELNEAAGVVRVTMMGTRITYIRKF
jgi:hypothetical protein